VMAGEQPIEQTRPGSANMQKTRGGGGETCDDRHGFLAKSEAIVANIRTV